jgi:hypothetical protein
MGALALQDGHPADALALFDRAQEKGALDAATSLNRAVALDRLGHRQAAATAYEHVAAHPESPPNVRAQAKSRAKALTASP